MSKWLKARVNETSTWRGVFMCIAAFGVAITPEQQDAIMVLGQALTATGFAVSGVINVFRKEK